MATGIPWHQAGPDVGQPLSDGLPIDVDPITMSRGELTGVSGRLGESDQHDSDRGREDDREICREIGDVRQEDGRQATRHIADQGYLETEQTCRQNPQAPRAPGLRVLGEPRNEDPGSPRARARPRRVSSGRLSPSDLIQLPNSRHVLVPSAEVPVSLGSSPTVTSRAAPNKKPLTTALERNWDIQPILRAASNTKRSPASKVTQLTSGRAARL